MSSSPRVRFAPSPTGYHHLGNFRSALFNWLAAHHADGTFVLRIEDTDRERLVPEAAAYLQQSLDWLGLTPTEGVVGEGTERGEFGPYTQSERLNIYRDHAEQLLSKGALYPCWCSSERLDGLRKAAQANGEAFKYDRHCLIEANRRSIDEPHVLRFRIPDGRGDITWNDVSWGEVSYNAAELDDFVCLKSDGYPTYNFAVVIDDHLMQISHVLRGSEFLPTTPKNILIYEAYDWTPPLWVHLPSVLGADKAKLSKRHGAVPVLEYRDAGYLPEAIINFLATLGWNDGTVQEIYSRDELVTAFSLERIQKSPAIFDAERLTWMNGHYIRALPLKELTSRCEAFWPASAADAQTDYKQTVLRLVQERVKVLSELPELTGFFFADPAVDQALLTATYDARLAKSHLDAIAELDCVWSLASIETALRGYVEANDLKTGQLFGLIRAAITGRTAAPGLFETMVTLGETTVRRRLKSASSSLKV